MIQSVMIFVIATMFPKLKQIRYYNISESQQSCLTTKNKWTYSTHTVGFKFQPVIYNGSTFINSNPKNKKFCSLTWLHCINLLIALLAWFYGFIYVF